MNSNGWIKLHRSLLDWEWYDDHNTFRVFMHCLLKANHQDKRYKGSIIKRGTFYTSRELLSAETTLSERQVRTALNKLKTTNELTIKTSKQGTVIEVVNYEKYQVIDQQSDQIKTNERPTNDQQTTSNKNDKNIKNDKNERSIIDRENDFRLKAQSYQSEYSFQLIDSFCDYWTESNEDGKKMKFEMQKTFDIGRRLKTWKRNDYGSNKKVKKQASDMFNREIY